MKEEVKFRLQERGLAAYFRPPKAMSLHFSTERRITPEQFTDVLRRSGLAERRPVDDDECVTGMVENSNLLATCWDDERLIGVARSITDFHYCCYLSDLAVDANYQRQGIGQRLIELTRERLGPRCSVILLAAPKAVEYYPRIGFTRHPQAWILPPASQGRERDRAGGHSSP